MIYLYSGATGSGKTSRAVRQAFNDWKQGIDIFSNIQLYFNENYKDKKGKVGRIYYFDVIDEIMDVTDGTILFDDAGVLFNAKSWEKIPIEFVHKLQLQRHHRLDLIATVPKIKTVHIDYRRLVHAWYYLDYKFKIGSQRKPKTILTVYGIQQKDPDDIEEVNTDALASNVKNWRGVEKRGKIRFIWYYSKKYYDTHAKINFRRYKAIWLMNKINQQVWILPKEMSLSEGLRLFTSLNYRLRQSKSRT